jgi:hypothetical protein
MLGPPREFVIHSFGTSTEMGLTNPRGAPSTKGAQKQTQTDKRTCVQKCVQKYVQKHVQKCVQKDVQKYLQKYVQNRVQNRVQKPVQKYVQNSVQKYVLSVQKAGGAVPKAVPEERSRTNDFVENLCILHIIWSKYFCTTFFTYFCTYFCSPALWACLLSPPSSLHGLLLLRAPFIVHVFAHLLLICLLHLLDTFSLISLFFSCSNMCSSVYSLNSAERVGSCRCW